MTTNNRQDLELKLKVAQDIAYREARLGLRGYLKNVVINSSPIPRRFGAVAEPWQTDIWAGADTAIEAVAFSRPYTGPHGFWRTLPRGHDKTSAIARRINWLLTFSHRPVTVITAAADQEQAGLITEAMDVEVKLNPWLPIRVFSKRARGPMGTLKILSSDAPTTWGLGADAYILDELTWWKKPDLFEPLITALRKRPGAIIIIITNAGVTGSWQHDHFTTVKLSPDWDVWESPQRQFLASWMDYGKMQDDRIMVGSGTAKRVFDNIWIDPGEESGYLTRAEVEACAALGQELGLSLLTKGRYGIDYVAGIDYGPKRDRTALCVVHHNADGQIQVDELTVWQGSPESPVQIAQVEAWIDDINTRFYRPLLVIDPYQMEGTVQRYEYRNKIERFESRGGKANYEMASTLRSLIVNRRLVWYPGAGDLPTPRGLETFTDELVRLVVKPTLYGYRFDHEAGHHDDRAVSVGMAALFAARNPPAPRWLPPPAIPNKIRTIVEYPEFDTGDHGLWGT